MPIPAELQTREQFTAAYDNLAVIADAGAVMAALRGRSQAFHAAHDCVPDTAYGAGARQVYDWYPARGADAAAAPVLVFIHGGYWQARDKRDFCCVGAGALAAGMHVVMAGYTLAPQARVPDMVAETGMLLDALWKHPVLGGGGRGPRIVLSGHSAGGHLAAMHRAHVAVAGVLAISGLFDLEPIRRGALNDALGLDEAQVAACSPQSRVGKGVATVLAAGGAEVPELRRQSREYFDALRGAGEPVRLLEIAQANHMSILAQLEDADGALLAEALALAAQARR
ncbi:MAG: alpha/beta hydrolase [Betaproteobacteria bacterium]|nr:alpha/beta hydrolase [Betaproteobacteria bacterium]